MQKKQFPRFFENRVELKTQSKRSFPYDKIFKMSCEKEAPLKIYNSIDVKFCAKLSLGICKLKRLDAFSYS